MTNDQHQDERKDTYATDPVSVDSRIDCKSLEDFIVDYIDGQLPSLQRKAFIDHIKECSPCKLYVNEYQKSISVSQAAYPEVHSSNCEQMPEELVQAILATNKRS